MVAELTRNGGAECRDYQRDPCTHIVVDNASVTAMPPDVRKDVHVVKSEWFWASIQMDACAEEKMHLFADYIGAFLSPRTPYFSPSTPGSQGRRKKRRTEAVRQLAQIGEATSASDSAAGTPKAGSSNSSSALLQVPSSRKKARSSVSGEGRLLLSPEVGDSSNRRGSSSAPDVAAAQAKETPTKRGATVQDQVAAGVVSPAAQPQPQQMTPRQQVRLESHY